MIEVLFGESEAASMKAAKSTVIYSKTNGPTSVFAVGKKVELVQEEFCWVEGIPEEVICLGVMLDIGDIKAAVSSDYRKNLIYSMLYQEQCGSDPEMQKELQQVGNEYVKELSRLKKYAEDGECIRIWYSKSPYSICGFYFVCDYLKRYKNQICVVKLPDYRVKANVITEYQNWGEVAAEEFSYFLKYQEELSEHERRMYASKWLELVEENSKLRVVVNNQLISAPETFYDYIIWNNLGNKTIKQARLIGKILGNYRIGIGDWWYAKRIQYFIEQGMIEVIEDSEKKYARIIRSCR
ncbi:MAG: DUF3658 domain-containing protein [Hespellia sp.]|nr:DUF3658 domain-containing protein [Hespellia sp.]